MLKRFNNCEVSLQERKIMSSAAYLFVLSHFQIDAIKKVEKTIKIYTLKTRHFLNKGKYAF